MVTGGAMAAVGAAHADSGAQGGAAGSPGLISGNTVQIPVHVPVNVCGNTVNVVGVLDPAIGNRCANGGDSALTAGDVRSAAKQAAADTRGTGADRDIRANHGIRADRTGTGRDQGSHRDIGALGGALAAADAQGSPGLLSGNGIQLPVDVPVNVSGNSVNVVGIGNAAVGNVSSNGPAAPNPVSRPPMEEVAAAHHEPHSTSAQLAQTGAAAGAVFTIPAGAAMILGGAVLYRRFRAAA
ncbi:chaplin [Streptomyces sp. SCSIO 30461]|uniref:chaplin n=1 Tax=Streptomyces sp. SCSIO 30461 TaxID=3118085 RepID=UPI0030D179D2